MRTIAAEFDAEYYRADNAGVDGPGLDALRHFVLHGAAAMRNPNRWFDMQYYRDANSDLHVTGFNPFWHYLVQGRAQGRPPRAAGAAQRQAFAGARTGPVRNPARAPEPMACLLPASLRAALEPRLTGAPDATLCVSHDRYTQAVGGVQILVSDEQLAFNARGGAYLHIAPVTPRLALAPEGEAPFHLHATLDGTYVGVTTYADLAAVLNELQPRLPAARRVVLHCVLGHQLPQLALLHAAMAPREAVFWVNDYESLCPGYNLLRNDAVFCGAPPPDSMACRVCVYGPERAAHLRAFRALFEAVPMHVVAPSPAALQVWQDGTDLPHLSAQVHAYAEILPDADSAGTPAAATAAEGNGQAAPAGPALRASRQSRRVRASSVEGASTTAVHVAFVGFPNPHKGWPAFQALAARLHGMAGFRLFHFATYAPDASPPGVEFVQVRVGPGRRGAMAEALRAAAIELVLVPSPWPETFCLVAYEALAAGADLAALADGGNVPDLVLHTGRGVVADDADALVAWFLSGGAARYAALAAAGPRGTGRLVSRGMTATLALPGTPALVPDHP